MNHVNSAILNADIGRWRRAGFSSIWNLLNQGGRIVTASARLLSIPMLAAVVVAAMSPVVMLQLWVRDRIKR